MNKLVCICTEDNKHGTTTEINGYKKGVNDSIECIKPTLNNFEKAIELLEECKRQLEPFKKSNPIVNFNLKEKIDEFLISLKK